MIKQSKVEPHWNYFLAVERDFEVLARYVDFDDRNFKCFSVELARLLLAAGAEVDVVCRQLCRAKNPTSKADKITDYRDEIMAAFPNFSGFHVRMPRYELELKPWDNWRVPGQAPIWWTSHNKVKHARHAEFHRASLENTLNAVAGLYVAVLHLYEDRARDGSLIPSPLLLRPDPDHFAGNTFNDFEFGINYALAGGAAGEQ